MATRADANPRRDTSLPAITQLQQHFSQEDVGRVIEQVAARGSRYAQMRKAMSERQASALLGRLQESSFVVSIGLCRRWRCGR